MPSFSSRRICLSHRTTDKCISVMFRFVLDLWHVNGVKYDAYLITQKTQNIPFVFENCALYGNFVTKIKRCWYLNISILCSPQWKKNITAANKRPPKPCQRAEKISIKFIFNNLWWLQGFNKFDNWIKCKWYAKQDEVQQKKKLASIALNAQVLESFKQSIYGTFATQKKTRISHAFNHNVVNVS